MTTTAVGTVRRFYAEAATEAPQDVWRLWTTPSTWGAWDLGLRDARLDGPFVVGAEGTLTDLGERTSRFHVTAVEPGRRCAYEVPLLGARLVLQRTLDGPGPRYGQDLWRVRHEVALLGPLAPLWALLLGRRFRRQLGPTVDGLLALAESRPDA